MVDHNVDSNLVDNSKSDQKIIFKNDLFKLISLKKSEIECNKPHFNIDRDCLSV